LYRHAINKPLLISFNNKNLLVPTLTGAPPGASYGHHASLLVLDLSSFRGQASERVCEALSVAMGARRPPPPVADAFPQGGHLFGEVVPRHGKIFSYVC
jgi:hypothetical protein